MSVFKDNHRNAALDRALGFSQDVSDDELDQLLSAVSGPDLESYDRAAAAVQLALISGSLSAAPEAVLRSLHAQAKTAHGHEI